MNAFYNFKKKMENYFNTSYNDFTNQRIDRWLSEFYEEWHNEHLKDKRKREETEKKLTAMKNKRLNEKANRIVTRDIAEKVKKMTNAKV